MQPLLGLFGSGGLSASSGASSGDAFSGPGASSPFGIGSSFQVTGSGSAKQDQSGGIPPTLAVIGVAFLAVAGVLGVMVYKS